VAARGKSQREAWRNNPCAFTWLALLSDLLTLTVADRNAFRIGHRDDAIRDV
jgi:hypothetical protein